MLFPCLRPCVLALTCLLLALLPARAQTAAPIRILPMGDSITFGSGGTANLGGYRSPLYTLLTQAGYTVDYIGSQTANSSGIPDPDHEGHGGWRIDQLDSNLLGWLGSFADPDVVLLHIGTNDFGQSLNITTAIDRLDALILKIATQRPHAHIIVTNLMERAEPYNANIQSLFNPFVQARVDAHASAGRQVTFLDMRSAVPLSDMPDNLHPNQVGYGKMAAVWLPAIQAVIGVNGDNARPELVRAQGSADRTHVSAIFSKPLADSAASLTNFGLSGGLTATAVSLDSSKRIITLTTSPQTLGTSYTITVNGVTDRLTTPNPIAANSVQAFFPATARGYLNHVPESANYTLAYSLDIPSLANYLGAAPVYSVDNHSAIGPFSRVAYWIELQSATGDLQYLWASMDAFSADANQIAVPTVASGAIFQQAVTNLSVISNVAGILNGSALSGNLEFWPTSYTAPAPANLPAADSVLFDFGDTRTATGTYGSMQLHNSVAGQTLFAFNNWGGSATTVNADLGIGNQPANNPDWTFANNAGNYSIKTLQVLVQTTGDLTAPAPLSATASSARTQVTVSFSEPLAAASINSSNFTLSNGATVLGASLAANQRDVILSTSILPAGGPLTLSISGVRDSSPNANLLAPNTTIAVVPAVLPPEILSRIGAAANGYQLVCSLNLPTIGNLNALGAAAYSFDERSASGPFTRVAYYLELQKTGLPSDYIWVSMDAFTAGRGKLGVPTAATGALFQKGVTNMEVLSNVAGVTTGSGLTGNLEFWPSNYTQAKSATLSPTNASDTTYDFGDSGASTTAGHGCMQIHNPVAGQTLFAINHFGVDGNGLDIGIGNQATGSPDWTSSNNAGAYTRRVLHVLVLPGITTSASLIANVPEAAGYQLAATVNIPAQGSLNNATSYSVDNRADAGAFSRIAYYLELKKPADSVSSFVWVSMDAFTNDPTKIGIPTTASGALFQQNLSNLNVVSNVAGVVNGTGITTGNIEFWAGNYAAPKAAGSPANASDTLYDFGDSGATTVAGHGSMQLHNYGAGQTLFSITNWGNLTSTTNLFGMGIGNQPTSNPDWTFAANSATYSTRLLQVYVLQGNSDSTPPTIARIVPSTQLNRLVVSLSETVAEGSDAPGNFSLSGGLNIISATLLANKTDIALVTSPQTPGTLYTLSVSGIRDRSPKANLMAPGSTATFSAYTAPAILSNIAETSGYQLIYQVAIPSAQPRWNLNAIPYGIDESKYGDAGFDRVAYLLELNGNWVYASFDPFTPSLSKIGVPTLNVTGTAFQQNVTHMNVSSNVPGIVTGTDLAGGNIEFWGGNYSAANALNIPNASATLYDFGDTMSAGTFGCMQVHNHDASQTLFAFNNWGSNSGGTCDLGFGNNPNAGLAGTGGTQGPDWTYSAAASTYSTRNLYVLARPAASSPTGTPPQILAHPTTRILLPGANTTLALQVGGTGPFTYQWRKDGTPIVGATKPWLEIANFNASLAGNYDAIVTGPGGATSTTLTATLSFSNQAPVFSGFTFSLGKNQAAALAHSVILSKASDADGDPLSITGIGALSTQGGTLNLQPTSLFYTPPAGFTGADSFTISISDGRSGNVTATINAFVSAAALNAAGQPTLATKPGGTLDLLFKGIPGQSYQIERSSNLVDWTPVSTTPAGDDGWIPAQDSAPPADKAFYRARRLSP